VRSQFSERRFGQPHKFDTNDFGIQNDSTPTFRIVRFLRPNILFYDGLVIELYQSTRALYLVSDEM